MDSLKFNKRANSCCQKLSTSGALSDRMAQAGTLTKVSNGRYVRCSQFYEGFFWNFEYFLKLIPKKPESEKQGSRKNVLLRPYAITNQNRFIELFTIALSLICRINELSSSFHLFKKCTESWPNSCGNFPSPWSSRPSLSSSTSWTIVQNFRFLDKHFRS